MKLSAQTLTLGPVGYGGCAQSEHSQWGKVTLDADGRVDDAFCGPSYYSHLTGQAMAKFVERETQLSISSMQEAREAFEAAEQRDQSRVSEKHRVILNAALKDSGLNGTAHPTTDWRGVLTGCKVHLNDYTQSLNLEHGTKGTRAVLTSHIKDGTHKMECPVDFRGHLGLDDCQEEVTLNVPWLSQPVIEHQGNGALVSMEDARLERLTEAAQLGFLVNPSELGPGWKSTQQGAVQNFKLENSSQEISLDSAGRRLTISARGWVSHGEHDTEISEKVVFQGGKFSKSR